MTLSGSIIRGTLSWMKRMRRMTVTMSSEIGLRRLNNKLCGLEREGHGYRKGSMPSDDYRMVSVWTCGISDLPDGEKGDRVSSNTPLKFIGLSCFPVRFSKFDISLE